MMHILLGARANALAIARSLQEPGCAYAIDFTSGSVCAHSRFVAKYLPVARDASQILNLLLDLTQTEPAILYPTDDYWAEFLASHDAELPANRFLFFRSPAAVAIAQDKLRIFELLRGRVLQPHTQLWDGTFRTDKIVKPRSSFFEGTVVEKGARGETIQKNAERGIQYIEQDRIDATLDKHYSIYGISFEGTILYPHTARKIMEYPHPLGTATLVSDGVDSTSASRLLELAKRVVTAIGYEGIFEIEAIQQGEDFVFIEINTRFWLQNGFPRLAGLNYACAYKDILLGRDPAQPSKVVAEGKERLWIHEGLALNLVTKPWKLLDVARIIRRCDAIQFAHYQKGDSGPLKEFLRCKISGSG